MGKKFSEKSGEVFFLGGGGCQMSREGEEELVMILKRTGFLK